MASKKGLLKGAKIARSHSTFLDVAEPVIAVAKSLPEVKKVSLGLIKVTKCTPGIKILEEKAGVLRLTVRSNTAVQIIWVYLTDAQDAATVTERLTAAFG